MIVREIPGWTIVSQQGREPIKNCQCPYIRTVPQFRFYPAWISISFNMHFSTLIFFLVSSLSITAALPVPGSDSNSENDRAVNTLFSKNGIWVFHDSSRGPLDHKSGAGHIGTINIPPAAIGNPCHNKGPLRCPPLTPNPVTSIPHRNNCAKESNRLGTQGTFDSLWNVERILTPVGILVVMIWLGFVAVGLVAIVDYVWMRWGRRYSGYPGVEVVEVGDEEKAEAN